MMGHAKVLPGFNLEIEQNRIFQTSTGETLNCFIQTSATWPKSITDYKHVKGHFAWTDGISRKQTRIMDKFVVHN